MRKVLAAEPNSSQGYRLKAMLEMRRGNPVEASIALDRAIARAPEDRNLLAMAASVSWARGDKQTAISQMSKAASQEPVRADLLAGLAEMLQGSGRPDDAVKALDSGIAAAKDAKGREAVFKAALHMKQLARAKGVAEIELVQRPKDPEPLLWMAAVLGSEGNEDGALEYVRRALDLRPDYYPALNALAKTVNSPEKRSEYETRLKKAVDSGSKEGSVYLDQARLLAGKGVGAEQIGALLDKGVTAAPTDLALREASIQYWLKAGRKDKALALAKEGEAAMPDSGPMLALSAHVQEVAGESSQAAIKFAQLSERFPDRVDWNLKYAQNLILAGKKQDAEKVLRRLIQQRPDEPAPYQALAKLQVDMGLSKEAQTTAEMLRDKPRMKALGLILLGDVYGATNRRPEALKAYSAAANAGLPEIALQKKVRLLDETGGSVLAATELAKWLAAHPNSVVGLSLAATRASDRRDYPEAAKYLEAVVKQDPENPVALNDLAWAYVMAKDPKALDVAAKAVSLAPNNPVVLDTLSQAQLNAGLKPAAIATARKALALDPKSGSIRVHLAELLAEEGNTQEAKELLSGIDEKQVDKEASLRLAKLKGML